MIDNASQHFGKIERGEEGRKEGGREGRCVVKIANDHVTSLSFRLDKRTQFWL